MAEWLTHSALTHSARVRSRTLKPFFNFIVKNHENFCLSTFLCGNTMALLFFHKNFGKGENIEKTVRNIEKSQKNSNFSKSLHETISAIVFPA
jgi:hypothetical protein